MTVELLAQYRALLMEEDQACEEIYRARLEGSNQKPAIDRFIAAHRITERFEREHGIGELEAIEAAL